MDSSSLLDEFNQSHCVDNANIFIFVIDNSWNLLIWIIIASCRGQTGEGSLWRSGRASQITSTTVEWADEKVIVYLFPIDFNIGNTVFKDCGDVDFRELVFAEDNQQAGLTTSTITNNYKFFTNGSHTWPEFCKDIQANKCIRTDRVNEMTLQNPAFLVQKIFADFTLFIKQML